MRAASTLLALCVSLAIAVQLSADEKKGIEKKPSKRPVLQAFERIRSLSSLNAAQKAKLDELKKQYVPKIEAAQEKTALDSVLTTEQKKARDEARKAAKAGGKSRAAIREAGEAAIKLTEAQKARLFDAQKELKNLREEAYTKIYAVLTDAQREQLKKEREAKRRQGRPEAGK